MPSTRNFRKKNNKTARKNRESKGRVWMLRKGNVVFCSRFPFMTISQKGMGSASASGRKGGAADNKSRAILKRMLFTKLPASVADDNIKKYLSNMKEPDQNKLVENILNTPIPKEPEGNQLANDMIKAATPGSIKPLLDEIEKNPDPDIQETGATALNDIGELLVSIVKKRRLAGQVLRAVKEKAKQKPGKFSQEDLDELEQTLTGDKLCDVKATVSSVSSKVFNGMSQGAQSVGQFLTPPPMIDENGLPIRRRNDTYVQLLWYPRSHTHYRKGKSTAVPKDKVKYGDFMIYVQPEKYADMYTYFANISNTVEDYFANILNGCTDSGCTKGNAIPEPYKHQVLQINNYQPEADMKELEKEILR